ncbi:MAG TPA: hypothetical protein VG318_13790 [Actinomycetota bacterium]|nr:hypothetical protein [Actinomycetota bacterium]
MQITDQQVRWWLTNLQKGRSLFDPELIACVRAHGHAVAGRTRAEVAAAAEQFLRSRIEALRAPKGASTHDQMPHAVLTLCFLEGWKASHAAKRLGLSERQMSRERSRAIAMLRDGMTSFPGDVPAPAPEPTSWAELTAQLARIEAAILAMRPGQPEAST